MSKSGVIGNSVSKDLGDVRLTKAHLVINLNNNLF